MDPERIKRKEVAFFGRITAGITHEIKNVLAIIQQSSGLMEDVLEVTEDSAFAHKDKFIKSIDRIRRQIQRGIDITNCLNWFAHSPDHTPVSLDLNEIAQQMVLLASRFARFKNVALETSPSDPPIVITSDPVSLVMALFESIEILLEAIDAEGRITLSPQKIQNRCVLGIGYENAIVVKEDLAAQISSTERWASLQQTMTYLGGAAKTLGPAPEILLYLPESINS